MALKTCRECGTKCGTRTLMCPECGLAFETKKRVLPKRFKQHVGIGAWINDPPKGMPKLEEPEELPDKPKTLNISHLSEIVAYEGLPYCVFEYIPADRIKDKKLAGMWKEAQELLSEIAGYVADKEIELAQS